MSAGIGVDLIVVGAGPAGLGAATVAAEAGARVVVLDDQSSAGGQVYRGIARSDAASLAILGEDYAKGRGLAERFAASGAEHRSGATVWQVTPEREVAYSCAGKSRIVSAPAILLATGALERPMPVQGWTLPGVMTAGAAQTLLKSSMLAADDAVFAGSGPLLYLIAAQYLRAGVRIAAVLDTTDAGALRRSAWHTPAALLRGDLLAKGRRWIAEVEAGGATVVRNITALRIDGETAATGVSYKTGGPDWTSVESQHVFLHQGVVPNVNLSISTGMRHDWDAGQLCWRPVTDPWGHSSLDGIFVAGDGGGISGATAAEAEGTLAGLAILARLGRISARERDARRRDAQAVLRSEGRIRPFLDAWFRPADAFRVPQDKTTIVCRCEELTAGDIEAAIGPGIAGPNQLKSFCRAGMGPCQGRQCGLTVQEIIAQRTGRPLAEVGYYRLRPPIKPVRLEELADMELPEASDAGGN
ncbi:MAG: FAD-dependent oxidoreductase [Hyphomicrobiaceae bacterium]|nr:FAD-dependent oxidoreductase [Hyphomicrobiaceae bacterium]